MEEYDIREIIVYKKQQGIPLTKTEQKAALKCMTQEEIDRLYRCMVTVSGCHNLNNIRKPEVAIKRILKQ